MADTSTPAGRKREAELIAAGKRAEGAAMPAEQMNRVKAAAGVAQATEFVERMDGTYTAPIAQGGSTSPAARSSACQSRAPSTATPKS